MTNQELFFLCMEATDSFPFTLLGTFYFCSLERIGSYSWLAVMWHLILAQEIYLMMILTNKLSGEELKQLEKHIIQYKIEDTT